MIVFRWGGGRGAERKRGEGRRGEGRVGKSGLKEESLIELRSTQPTCNKKIKMKPDATSN